MPIEFAWDDEPCIVIEKYTGVWSIEDSRAIWAEEQKALASHQGRLDAIILIHDLHLPLSGMRHFTEVSRSQFLSGDRLGLAVLIGLKSSDQPIFDLFLKLYPALAHKLALASSVDEAKQLIIAHRVSLQG